jgi:pilus assembly protein CpaE
MPIIDARHYKTLLICPAKAVLNELRPMLAHGLPLAPIHDVSVYPNRLQLVELIRTFPPTVCFLEVSSSKPDAATAMSDLQALIPDAPIIAVLASNDPDLILQCLRRGAADFLVRPFTADQIDACIDKLSLTLPAHNPKPASGGKIIAVFPAKGASGATTVACNVAFQCKRSGAKRTLLADLDPLTGTVSFVLKVKSSYSFMDVLHRQGMLDSDLWKQMVTVSHGTDVLLPPESLVDPATDLRSAEPILDYAQTIYDATILDCGSAYGSWNLSLAQMCDDLLLVTTTELPSLQATQRVIAYFDHNRVDTSKIKLVVNRITKEVGLNLDNIAKAFRGEIFQTIPADTDAVQKSLMDGKPIPASTTIGKTFSALTDKLINVKDRETRKASAKAGLFSSIFSR